MINRIKLVFGHQFEQVRKLEGGNALWLQQARKACNEIIDVRHVCEHIVGRGKVGLRALRNQLFGESDAEKILNDGNTFGARGGGCAGCRFDPGTRDTFGFYLLKQIAIVGGDFHDMAGCIETETGDHRVHVAFGMREPTG